VVGFGVNLDFAGATPVGEDHQAMVVDDRSALDHRRCHFVVRHVGYDRGHAVGFNRHDGRH
jgi:hypothetical protein